MDDELLKGEIEGKAKFLSSYLGEAGLAGEIEAARTDVFSKTPDDLKSRADAYLQYQVCTLLVSDKEMSTTEKINELVRVRQSFN